MNYFWCFFTSACPDYWPHWPRTRKQYNKNTHTIIYIYIVFAWFWRGQFSRLPNWKTGMSRGMSLGPGMLDQNMHLLQRFWSGEWVYHRCKSNTAMPAKDSHVKTWLHGSDPTFLNEKRIERERRAILLSLVLFNFGWLPKDSKPGFPGIISCSSQFQEETSNKQNT